MVENKQKNSGPTRKQAILISSGILLVAVAVAGFIIWQAMQNDAGTNTPDDIEVSQIEAREDSVLFAPDPYEASQEEIEEYENFLQSNTIDTDTLNIEGGCLIDPVVARITTPHEMRIVNNTESTHTFRFKGEEYDILVDGTELIDVSPVAGEGRHYYFCDEVLAGIIILENSEL